MADALIKEAELHDFCDWFSLHDRLVRDEPPTLLYAARFHKVQTQLTFDFFYNNSPFYYCLHFQYDVPELDMASKLHTLLTQTVSH
jgi:hypothetical protein